MISRPSVFIRCSIGRRRSHTRLSLTAVAMGVVLAATPVDAQGRRSEATAAPTKDVAVRPLRASATLPIAEQMRASAVKPLHAELSTQLRAHPKQKGAKRARRAARQATVPGALEASPVAIAAPAPTPPLPVIAPAAKAKPRP